MLGTFFLFCAPATIEIATEMELPVFGSLVLAASIWMANGVAGGIQAVVRRVWRGSDAIAAIPMEAGGAA